MTYYIFALRFFRYTKDVDKKFLACFEYLFFIQGLFINSICDKPPYKNLIVNGLVLAK